MSSTFSAMPRLRSSSSPARANSTSSAALLVCPRQLRDTTDVTIVSWKQINLPTMSRTPMKTEEYLKLKESVEALQQSQRHILGEDLAQLSTEELDQLEHVVDGSLKRMRSKENQHLFDKLADLRQKERDLLEVNTALMSKLEEAGGQLQSTWQLQPEINAHYLQPDAF